MWLFLFEYGCCRIVESDKEHDENEFGRKQIWIRISILDFFADTNSDNSDSRFHISILTSFSSKRTPGPKQLVHLQLPQMDYPWRVVGLTSQGHTLCAVLEKYNKIFILLIW